jgi:hypothetical protein
VEERNPNSGDSMTNNKEQLAPETVADLKQPTTFAGLSDRVEGEIERAYWVFDDKKKGYMPMSERDAFKWAVRNLFLRIREAP